MVRRNKSRESAVTHAVVHMCRGSKGRKHKGMTNRFFQFSILSYRFLSLVLNIGKDTLNYLMFNNLEYDSSGFNIWGSDGISFF